jgi:acyl-CoA dehydrogenase
MAATLFFFGAALAVAIVMGVRRVPLWAWAVLAGVSTLLFDLGYQREVISAPGGPVIALAGWALTLVLALLCIPQVRRAALTAPLYRYMKRITPAMSATEQEALDAGDVGFDAEFFSGDPDWRKLAALRAPSLTTEERAFIDGPTEELCTLLNDWEIRHDRRDIPEKVWKFAAENGFFGMLISKEHGGLGFSPEAQSLVIGKIASRSPDGATIVMVPNSLGPGELIEKFGSDEQKRHYLPRLARGEETPCFALTSPFAGSDAASMRDIGVVVRGTHDGQETVGVRLNWDKRYITLAPNATLLGLAFRLFDPEGLLGKEGEEKREDIGITLALVPANHPGVRIGDRHQPCGNAFPNGPTWGENVFIPLDWIIGGAGRAGQGWRMLMSCLSAGRAISLPASSTAAAKALLRFTSAYARVRKQFGLPIGRMEGIEEPMARMVETAYTLEAARSVTAVMVAGGQKPAVISALMKYQATERMRQSVQDAMDIHGGKGICDGPSNYLQAAYQAVPIAITVEGANILTRCLIVFAQGALRSHPWLIKSVHALQEPDEAKGIDALEDALRGHVAYSMANITGAFFHNITFGLFAKAPGGSRQAYWYKQTYRASRNFALIADLSIGLLAGGLKTRQRVTSRLADALSELYLLSCVLKRFENDGEPESDRVLVELCARNGLRRFYEALRGAVDNFPVVPARAVMRVLAFPFGNHFRPASDALGKAAVKLTLAPSEARDRLTRDIFICRDENDVTGALELAFEKAHALDEADRKLEKAVRSGIVKRFLGHDWMAEAAAKGVITADEAADLSELNRLVARVIAVDHFTASAIAPQSAAPVEAQIQPATDVRAAE